LPAHPTCQKQRHQELRLHDSAAVRPGTHCDCWQQREGRAWAANLLREKRRDPKSAGGRANECTWGSARRSQVPRPTRRHVGCLPLRGPTVCGTTARRRKAGTGAARAGFEEVSAVVLARHPESDVAGVRMSAPEDARVWSAFTISPSTSRPSHPGLTGRKRVSGTPGAVFLVFSSGWPACCGPAVRDHLVVTDSTHSDGYSPVQPTTLITSSTLLGRSSCAWPPPQQISEHNLVKLPVPGSRGTYMALIMVTAGAGPTPGGGLQCTHFNTAPAAGFDISCMPAHSLRCAAPPRPGQQLK